jgi:hypothetical protein
LAAEQIEHADLEVPILYNDGYVPPAHVPGPAKSRTAHVPARTAAISTTAPRLPCRHFSVPRGTR